MRVYDRDGLCSALDEAGRAEGEERALRAEAEALALMAHVKNPPPLYPESP